MFVAERRTRQDSRPARSVHRFTVEQYHDMIASGILKPSDRVELLEGWIVDKTARNPPHDATVTRVNRRLLKVLPEQWLLRVQAAITLAESEPEPGFAIARGPESLYLKRHPRPRDLALVIEVADSTLLNDRLHKLRYYAQARIPHYWIINLVHGLIQCYEQPRAGKNPTYRRQLDLQPSASVSLPLDDPLDAIPVADLLP